jgi:outer membrane protein
MNRLMPAVMLVFWFGCFGSAIGRELSLTETIDLAVQHSYTLRAAASQTEAFDQALRAAQAERLPTLSAVAAANYVSEVATLNISVPPLLSLSREMGTKENYQTDLKLSVPLFTGGRITGGIEMARANRDYYEALRKASVDQVIFQARSEYLSLLGADRLLDAAKASLERAAIIQRDIASLYSAGAADSVDLLDASLVATKAEFAVRQAQTNRRAAEIRVQMLLGLDVGDGIVVTQRLADPVIEPPVEPEVTDSKPELLAAEAAVKVSRSQVRLAGSEYFPSLSLFGGYSYGKPNLDRFNNTWNDYFTVGATLSWSFNLGNKTSRGWRKAKALYEASVSQRSGTADRLSREARLAAEQLKLAAERYETARTNCRITGDNYRLACEKHRQGVLSSNRLLDIEAALTEAEASAAAALVDYYLAKSAYYYAVGSEKLREGI